MDISAIIFLSSIGLNLACMVYIVSQGAKAIIWLFKFLRDEDEGMYMSQNYRCKKCGLKFWHCEETPEEGQGKLSVQDCVPDR